ncbi:MAG: hypothetical protein LBH20_02130 [Treponema sp.]|nr:hypothetical protein [Treponema sp.]
MANKMLWLGILLMALVFTILVVGCDEDSNKTPHWIAVKPGEYLPMTGILSDNNTKIFIEEDFHKANQVTFIKEGAGGVLLSGVWYSDDNGKQKLTISGNNWTLAFMDRGGTGDKDPVMPPPQGSVSRAIGDYYDAYKGTLEVEGTTVIFIVTQWWGTEGDHGESGKKEPDEP